MEEKRITRKPTVGMASTSDRRRFVHPTLRLSETEIEHLRQSGFIPVEIEKGETTRLVNLRLDSETMKQLRGLRLRLKKKKLNESELLRLVILKGLEHSKEIMDNSRISQDTS